MPQDYKTSVNNLIIVWQGSNWSVIAPDGTVIARFFMKRTAIDFAKSIHDYSSKTFRNEKSKIAGSQTIYSDGVRSSENASDLVVEWLFTRHDIFPATNDENPLYLEVSVAHDSHNNMLIVRHNVLSIDSEMVTYINPELLEANDLPVFRIEVLRYGLGTSPILGLLPRYIEDKDVFYVTVQEKGLEGDNSGSVDERFVLEHIYRKKSDGFHRTMNTREIDFAKWVAVFITRTEKNKQSIDHRKETWNNKPTIYGMYRKQQSVDSRRQREHKNPKQE